MISLFQISPQDQSIYYLSQVFGLVGPLLPAKNPVLIMGVLFKVFNTIALTVGALIVIYTIVIGLINTAQEGEFLGRHWNKVWVPLRTVGGIICLFPTASGYSIIQIIFMWFIVQGIGAADNLWTTTIKYISSVGGLSSAVTTPDVNKAGTTSSMKTLFQSLVCQASAKLDYPTLTPSDGEGAISWYCNVNSDQPFCKQSFQQMHKFDQHCNLTSGCVTSSGSESPDYTTYPMGPQGLCGTLNLTACDAKEKGESWKDFASGKEDNIGGDTGGIGAGTLTLCKSKNSANMLPPVITGSDGKTMYASDCMEARLCKAQREALADVVLVLGQVANQVATIDHQYAQYFDTANIDCSQTNACKPMFQVPQWMQTYCTDSGMQNCCVKLDEKTQNGCSILKSGTGGLGYINYNIKSGQFNPYETSYYPSGENKENAAIEKLYAKYAMPAYLGEANIDFISAATSEYVASIMAAYAKYQADKVIASSATGLTDWKADAVNAGWIQAGSFIFKIAREGANNQGSLDRYMSFSVSPNPGTSAPLGQSVRSNFGAAGALVTAVQKRAKEKGGPAGVAPGFSQGTDIPGFNQIADTMKEGAGTLLDTFMKNLAGQADVANKSAEAGVAYGGKNPLVSLATFGYMMMVLAQYLFLVIVEIMVLLGIGNSLASFMTWGFGFATGPLGSALAAVSILLMPFLALLVSSLYILGATLGIYVPLIPYIVFVVGGLGWILSTVEAMVAAPIVALGILMPGGQHELMGRAEASMMHLLGIFLRPSLMIIGLIISMLVVTVGLNLLNSGFLYVVTSIMSHPGLFEEIMFIAVYTSIVVTFVNKSFSPVYMLPNQVLSWIGGHVTPQGEPGEALQAAKGAAEGAASQVGKSAQGGAGSLAAPGADFTEASRDKKHGAAGIKPGGDAPAGGGPDKGGPDKD